LPDKPSISFPVLQSWISILTKVWGYLFDESMKMQLLTVHSEFIHYVKLYLPLAVYF